MASSLPLLLKNESSTAKASPLACWVPNGGFCEVLSTDAPLRSAGFAATVGAVHAIGVNEESQRFVPIALLSREEDERSVAHSTLALDVNVVSARKHGVVLFGRVSGEHALWEHGFPLEAPEPFADLVLGNFEP